MKTFATFFLIAIILTFVSCNQKAKTVPEKTQEKETATKLTDTIVQQKVNSHESQIKKDIDYTSKLEEKVQRLSQLEHTYLLKKLEVVTPAETILLSRLTYVATVKKNAFKALDLDAIQNDLYEIRTSFLKGTKPMQPNGNTYPRVTIEEYIFKSKERAISCYKALLQSKKEASDWNFVAKEPHALFLEENSIYFVSSGGYYMMDIYEEIVKKIKG
jgi:hypothetical protein